MACDKPKPIYYALLRQKTLRGEKKTGKENFQVEIRNSVYMCWQTAAIRSLSLFVFFNPD